MSRLPSMSSRLIYRYLFAPSLRMRFQRYGSNNGKRTSKSFETAVPNMNTGGQEDVLPNYCLTEATLWTHTPAVDAESRNGIASSNIYQSSMFYKDGNDWGDPDENIVYFETELPKTSGMCTFPVLSHTLPADMPDEELKKYKYINYQDNESDIYLHSSFPIKAEEKCADKINEELGVVTEQPDQQTGYYFGDFNETLIHDNNITATADQSDSDASEYKHLYVYRAKDDENSQATSDVETNDDDVTNNKDFEENDGDDTHVILEKKDLPLITALAEAAAEETFHSMLGYIKAAERIDLSDKDANSTDELRATIDAQDTNEHINQTDKDNRSHDEAQANIYEQHTNEHINPRDDGYIDEPRATLYEQHTNEPIDLTNKYERTNDEPRATLYEQQTHEDEPIVRYKAFSTIYVPADGADEVETVAATEPVPDNFTNDIGSVGKVVEAVDVTESVPDDITNEVAAVGEVVETVAVTESASAPENSSNEVSATDVNNEATAAEITDDITDIISAVDPDDTTNERVETCDTWEAIGTTVADDANDAPTAHLKEMSAETETRMGSVDTIGRFVIDEPESEITSPESRELMRFALLQALRKLEDNSTGITAKIVITKPEEM